MNNRSLAPQIFTFRQVSNAVGNADRPSLIALIVANAVPVVLAIVFGWNVGDVAMFYWWENIVIGIYAMLRIAMAKAGGRAMLPAKFFLVPFFTFHYFFFCFVHVIFLQVFFCSDLFGSTSPDLSSLLDLNELLPVAAVIGLAALVFSHGFSFFRNYIVGGEYKTAVSILEMFRPYGRIVVLHIGIIFGGLLIQWFGSPMPMVILLMIGKTLLDIASHSISHKISQSVATRDINTKRRFKTGREYGSRLAESCFAAPNDSESRSSMVLKCPLESPGTGCYLSTSLKR